MGNDLLIGNPKQNQGNGEGITIVDNPMTPEVVEPMVAPKEPWKNLFIGSKMAAKGASLSFVTLVIQEGRKIAQLKQNELDV